MNRGHLEFQIARGLSTRAIARHLDCSQFKVRYWLGKYSIRTLRARTAAVPGECRLCERPLKTKRRRRCPSCDTRVRRYRQKARAVATLGGKCQGCGWSGTLAGFSFHHVRGKKSFTIGMVANRAWSVIEEEIKKCDLLCMTCHAIEHSKHADDALAAEIARSVNDAQTWWQDSPLVRD